MTDEIDWAPAEDPIHVNDFQAPLLYFFGLDHERLTFNYRGLPARLTNVAGEVVHEVIDSAA